MKIVYFGNFGVGWDGSICDEEHIAKVLEHSGHQVIRIQRERWDEVSTKTYKVNFVLISQWDGYPQKLFLDAIRDLYRCPIVYWAFDYQDQHQEWHDTLASGSDLYLSKRWADHVYPNWQWFSQDFAPQFLQRVTGVKKDMDVLFTGSHLPWATERIRTLQEVDKNFNLTIHTVTPKEWREAGLKDVRGPVMDHDLPPLIARAKVNLSIDHTLEPGYWSDRNGQIIACGGFVFARYVPGMESRFHSHVVYHYSIEDCLRNLQHWLDYDEDREVIAAQAYEYAALFRVRQKVADLLTIVRRIL